MSSHQNRPLLLSVADTSRKLGIGKTRLYQTLREGRLSSLRIGRKRLITAESVERLIVEAASSDISASANEAARRSTNR